MLNFINKWKNKVTQHVELRLDLLKLEFIERTSGILGFFIFIFICLLFSLCILVFAGIGMGEFFSALLENRAGGFFLTAAIFLFCFLVLALGRKKIIGLFTGIFISIMTDGDDDDDDDEKKPTKSE
ncbi:MAG TPA: hypothetical protein VL098_04380 [Flavipsychrobacter sp.]|nr:hypothetical protein [Flavipsychrobacter sp.]